MIDERGRDVPPHDHLVQHASPHPRHGAAEFQTRRFTTTVGRVPLTVILLEQISHLVV